SVRSGPASAGIRKPARKPVSQHAVWYVSSPENILKQQWMVSLHRVRRRCHSGIAARLRLGWRGAGLSLNEHGIAIAVETVPFCNGRAIGRKHEFPPCKGTDEQKQRGVREMEIGH